MSQSVANSEQRKNPNTQTPSKSIGKNIAKIRKSRGLTQIELAEAIGATQKMISDYETGRIHINEEIIKRIAISLKITADEILGIKDSILTENANLRIMRRLKELDQLPEVKKKAILKTLDDLIRANT